MERSLVTFLNVVCFFKIQKNGERNDEIDAGVDLY